MGGMPDLKGKVALITGAGTGFGRSISVVLARAGAQVVGVGRREDRLAETAKAAGERFHPLKWDVSEARYATDLVREVVAKAGGLHILVNNAGVMLGEGAPLSRFTLEDWESGLRTNVTGPFALTQAAFEVMRKQRYGRILNVSSGLGFRPMVEYGAYCVTKAALNMLTRAFALESGTHNVLINAIDPGVAKTEMNPEATQSPDTINSVALHLASLPEGGANGKCFNKRLELVTW